jgi:hypothetical protein
MSPVGRICPQEPSRFLIDLKTAELGASSPACDAPPRACTDTSAQDLVARSIGEDHGDFVLTPLLPPARYRRDRRCVRQLNNVRIRPRTVR